LADSAQDSVSESFISEVRTVLGFLYDWVALRSSPLVRLFGMAEQDDPPLALRHLLLDAIEALKPAPQVLPSARAWRTYQLLLIRYAEQFSQAETAAELGLSVRHLRREEGAAIERLAAYLWDHYDLETKWRKPASALPPQPDDQPGFVSETPSTQQELGWLEASSPHELVDVAQMIASVLDLLRPFAEATEVNLDYVPPGSFPLLLAQQTTLRQALLTVCAAAVRSAAGGQVSVQFQSVGSEASIVLEVVSPRMTPAHLEAERERLEMTRRLIEMSQGSLTYTIPEGPGDPVSLTLTLPAEGQVPVLVIDDNADTLQLLERYLSGSRYEFIGASDPAQAMELIEEAAPEIIVLDVMLPQIDGWELLGRLRQHPQACNAPVIVCSILPQEQLALALGAAGLIRKPVTRDALLSALDHHLERSQTGSSTPC
jgi:CheY-like chemotaxis protein